MQLGVSVEQLATRMPQLQSVAMRLEVKAGVRGLTLIDDAYNADLTSLDIALDFLHRRKEVHHKSMLVLSDFQQTGMPAGELYQRVATLIRIASCGQSHRHRPRSETFAESSAMSGGMLRPYG